MGLALEWKPASYQQSSAVKNEKLGLLRWTAGESTVCFGELARKSPQTCPHSHTHPCQGWKLPSQKVKEKNCQICTLSHTDSTQGLAPPPPSWLVGTPSSHTTRLMSMTAIRALLILEDHRWIFHCRLPRDHKCNCGQVLHLIYSQLFPLPLNYVGLKATFILFRYKSGSRWSELLHRDWKPGPR